MLDAVVAPRKSLGLTALLFVVFEYIFAIFGFAFMRCVRCNTLQCSKTELTLPLCSHLQIQVRGLRRRLPRPVLQPVLQLVCVLPHHVWCVWLLRLKPFLAVYRTHSHTRDRCAAADQGFKHDGGLGGYLGSNLFRAGEDDNRRDWSLRLVYDNLFNIILLTVLLNIVFGMHCSAAVVWHVVLTRLLRVLRRCRYHYRHLC